MPKPRQFHHQHRPTVACMEQCPEFERVECEGDLHFYVDTSHHGHTVKGGGVWCKRDPEPCKQGKVTITDTVSEVIDGRQSVYGEVVNGMCRIAQMWSAIIDNPVMPADVPLMMIALKLVRAHNAPDYGDNPDDIEGYLDIFRQVVGEDMIDARSVSDYLEQKLARAQA